MGITIVALGPGDAEAIPASALRLVQEATAVYARPLDQSVVDVLGVTISPLPAEVPDGAVVVASDFDAHRLAVEMPEATTSPDRAALRLRAIGAGVARLASVGSHLRIHCPWDRVQTAATIVPHTVEEAFEVAEAVGSGDVAKQADEIGDLLFQSVFLAQLLEESGDPDLGQIANDHADKLIFRHPHVYGEAVAESAGGVRDLWETNKRAERGGGIFHEMPPGLPALAYATKAQKRADAVGFDFTSPEEALAKLDEEVAELHADPNIHELGDVMFACVAVARRLKIDPEIAVRQAAQRFRDRVERAEQLAAAAGENWTELDIDAQERWYQQAKALS